MEPFERLIEVVDSVYSGNKAEFARAMGVSAQGVTPYLNGSRNIGGAWRTRLKELGINSEWVIKGKGEMLLPVKEENKQVNQSEMIEFLKDHIKTLKEQLSVCNRVINDYLDKRVLPPDNAHSFQAMDKEEVVIPSGANFHKQTNLTFNDKQESYI